MATFELISQLHVLAQERLTAINAKSSANRTTQESAFLAALLPYVDNKVLRYASSGDATETQSNDLILEAQGNTLPTGYSGFKHGAKF